MVENFHSFKLVEENSLIFVNIPEVIRDRTDSFLVVSAIGHQNTGKSTFLNSLLGTSFEVRKLSKDIDPHLRNTNGIDAALCNGYLALDVEGLYAREETKEYSISYGAFAFIVSDVVIWCIRTSSIVADDMWQNFKVTMDNYLKFRDTKATPKLCIFLVIDHPEENAFHYSKSEIKKRIEAISVGLGHSLSQAIVFECLDAQYNKDKMQADNPKIIDCIGTCIKKTLNIGATLNHWEDIFNDIKARNEGIHSTYLSNKQHLFNGKKREIRNKIKKKFTDECLLDIINQKRELETVQGEMDSISNIMAEFEPYIEKQDFDGFVREMESMISKMFTSAERRRYLKQGISVGAVAATLLYLFRKREIIYGIISSKKFIAVGRAVVGRAVVGGAVAVAVTGAVAVTVVLSRYPGLTAYICSKISNINQPQPQQV